MRHGIHFISGLPRSGSTLFSAILRQNPRFHAMMTRPVGGIYTAMLGAVSRKNEAAVFIEPDQKRELLAGVFRNYYHAIGAEKVVFDTNRIWCSKMPALTRLFPQAKVICCVRHIPWIMDSIERLERRNAFDLSGMFGFDAGSTVYTRIGRLAGSDGMVGYALDCLREAFYGGYADRMIVVTYEALTRDPAGTLKSSTTSSASRCSSTTSTTSNTARTTSTRAWARQACIPCVARSGSSSDRASCRRNCSRASRTTRSG